MDEIARLELVKAQVQQQAAFEIGKIEGRIELLKEQAKARESQPSEAKTENES